MAYHTSSHGPDVAAFQNAIVKASALAQAASVDVIYLAPTLAVIDSHAGEQVMGADWLKAFKKNGRGTVNGVTFHLETARKKSGQGSAIVFCPYIPLDQMTSIANDYRTLDWVFVPWAETEKDDYEATYPNSVVV